MGKRSAAVLENDEAWLRKSSGRNEGFAVADSSVSFAVAAEYYS